MRAVHAARAVDVEVVADTEYLGAAADQVRVLRLGVAELELGQKGRLVEHPAVAVQDRIDPPKPGARCAGFLMRGDVS